MSGMTYQIITRTRAVPAGCEVTVARIYPDLEKLTAVVPAVDAIVEATATAMTAHLKPKE